MKCTAIISVALACALTAVSLRAQETFVFTPSGLAHFDGAFYLPKNDGTFADGVAIPDIRIGAKAEYGNWLAKIDVGFGYGKVSVKDVYLQYRFNPSMLLRGGYFIQQFGMQAAVSSSFKETFEAPITEFYMNLAGRNTGLMYVFSKGSWFATASAIVGTKITETANDAGRISLGGISRLLYRPIVRDGMLLQFGVSNWYQSAFHQKITAADGTSQNSKGYFNFSANYPTRVDKVTLLSADVENARGVYKLAPELLFSKGRFAVGAQYYYMNVNRKDGLKPYVAQGAYGVARMLILGDREYGYTMMDGILATPKPKTFEVAAAYNYTKASDSSAGVFGGIANDYSVTLNYYINKYMLCRLRWSYTDLRDIPGRPRTHVNIIQARIQFKF